MFYKMLNKFQLVCTGYAMCIFYTVKIDTPGYFPKKNNVLLVFGWNI